MSVSPDGNRRMERRPERLRKNKGAAALRSRTAARLPPIPACKLSARRRRLHLFHAFYKRLQLAAAAGMTQFAQGLRFDLANALSRALEALAHFFERVLIARFGVMTDRDDLFLASSRSA